MNGFRRAISLVASGAALSLVCVASMAAQKDDGKSDKAQRPKLTLKAQPAYGVAPVRVVLTAELVGGADDFEEYYCPTLRWEWADDTSSESSSDCAPYEAGHTSIKRRFTVEHNFTRAGSYKVYVRLKQRDREVAATSTLLQIQPGAAQYNP
jgi:hypothetical protein